MESKTSPRFGEEISKSTEAINQKESVSEYDGTYSTTELGDTRMDKLLSNRKHENSADQNRWMVANANANHHMETMEGESKANVGTAEAGSTRMDGQEDGRIRRPLSGRSKDNRITSNNKRNPRKARTHQLCRLPVSYTHLVKGKYEETTKGTPQGGNLSPLLSNIMLNELDKELEARGLNFVRYADYTEVETMPKLFIKANSLKRFQISFSA